MRKRLPFLLLFLLLLGFVGAVFRLRLPKAGAVTVRAEPVEDARTLVGGDEDAHLSRELLPGELLDLNAASAEELQRLPGIGPALAEAIVSYRAEHGPFVEKEDVMKVPGIGPARYAAIADSITAEGTP